MSELVETIVKGFAYWLMYHKVEFGLCLNPVNES